jgi:predicted hydrocarbon binding protein
LCSTIFISINLEGDNMLSAAYSQSHMRTGRHNAMDESAQTLLRTAYQAVHDAPAEQLPAVHQVTVRTALEAWWALLAHNDETPLAEWVTRSQHEASTDQPAGRRLWSAIDMLYDQLCVVLVGQASDQDVLVAALQQLGATTTHMRAYAGSVVSPQPPQATEQMTVTHTLVGQMLRDLQAIGGLSEQVMFQAGYELALRVAAPSLDHFLAAYREMGLGNLQLAEANPAQQRWVFHGEGLVEERPTRQQPAGHYTRGFVCGAVAHVIGAARAVGVEIACQSMGDARCTFVVQPAG